ncbi:MAG: fluoride efflux transporter CrcB [Acidobacteria bacterium]|nr:fluoride efflux transporter CrcB [Acidobacteriota bacterium]
MSFSCKEEKVETLTKYFAVAAGGAVGAMLRYYLGGTLLARTGAPFPTATFVINITGSFILGFFLTIVTERIYVSPHLRLAIAVGFVGAYTTFSTFEYETARLVEEKFMLQAFLYVVLSFAVGFAAVWGGIFAARKLEGLPVMSSLAYESFEAQAAEQDAAQARGAERDIRDSSIERL